MGSQAFITPGVLRWARLRDHLTTEDAAKRLSVKPERFEAWERGTERPTFRQAESVAHHLRVPFGYLFLSEPPVETLPLPDLRTIADQPVEIPRTELWAAQIFTLAHELAHIWVGESGISNPGYRAASGQQSNPVERLCNRAAAEVLLPASEFLAAWHEARQLTANVTSLG